MIKCLLISIAIFISSTASSTVFSDKEVYVITNGNVYQVFGDKMFKLEYVGGEYLLSNEWQPITKGGFVEGYFEGVE